MDERERPLPIPAAAPDPDPTVMEPAPTPTTPSPTSHRPAEGGGSSRRWFLAGGVALVVGGGGGVLAELLHHHPSAQPTLPPADVVAALESERTLIADLDATTGGSGKVRQVIKQARADHAAHLRALRELVATYDAAPATKSAPGSSTSAPGTPRTRAQLRLAEQRAATTAAQRAAAVDGPNAALLASIAACEATHAELLG